MKALGIDLGTSSSAVAILEDDKIKIIPSSDDNAVDIKPFPSVVSFLNDGSCKIGKEAQEESLYNPNGTIFNVKKIMGSGQTIKIFEKSYLPQFISALLLMQMKIKAEKFLNEKITKAVITVPAYFNDSQRQATRDAGKIAGLDVIHILNEPVAASIAYGLNRFETPTKILVFDMGAGTLDVSILEADGGFFEVLSTSGSNNLGGVNIDEIVEKTLTDEIKKTYEKELDESAKLQIKQLAETIKKQLSSKDYVDVTREISVNDDIVKISITITREKFNSMIEPIIKKSKDCIMDSIKSANLEISDIDKVVLVGGPTNIPSIKKMISETIRDAESDFDPTFTVAIGAAIQGANLCGNENLPTMYGGMVLANKTSPAVYGGIVLANKTPLDLGEHAKKKDRIEFIKTMIPKNTTYPTEHSDEFYVNKIMQTEVSIDVWQGEDFEAKPDFIDNVKIGQFWLKGLRRGAANRVKITYHIDADGILTVTAEELGGESQGQLTIDKLGSSVIPPLQLEFEQEELEKIEKIVRKHTMSPYEIPVEDYRPSKSQTVQDAGEYSWWCDCLAEAKCIIKTHHIDPEYSPSFFDAADFELGLQTDWQYAYAYIVMTGGPVYPIYIHNCMKENVSHNQRLLIVTLVHELLHAIHPNWGHNRIRPAERRLANLGGYFDAYKEMETKLLSGQMSLCNNSMTPGESTMKIRCPK